MRAKGHPEKHHEIDQKYILTALIALCLTLLFSCAAAAGDIGLSVSTDKAGYAPGEDVIITGSMQSGGKGLQGELTLQINDPGGTPAAVENIATDAHGSFTFKYHPGADNVKFGTYTVILAIGDSRAGTSFTVSSTGGNSGGGGSGGGSGGGGSSSSSASSSSAAPFLPPLIFRKH